MRMSAARKLGIPINAPRTHRIIAHRSIRSSLPIPLLLSEGCGTSEAGAGIPEAGAGALDAWAGAVEAGAGTAEAGAGAPDRPSNLNRAPIPATRHPDKEEHGAEVLHDLSAHQVVWAVAAFIQRRVQLLIVGEDYSLRRVGMGIEYLQSSTRKTFRPRNALGAQKATATNINTTTIYLVA